MQNEQSKSFKELLQEELEDRINEIESPDYEYVPRLTKGDYILLNIKQKPIGDLKDLKVYSFQVP